MCQHVIDLNDFICPNLFYSECEGAGSVVSFSGTAAENKKPEDANSAAGIILVERAGGRGCSFLSHPLNRFQQKYFKK